MTSPGRLRSVKIFPGHPRLKFERKEVIAVIAALDAAASPATDCTRGTWRPPAGELSIAFLTDAALARLHADFLDDPTPTDVITFPAEPRTGLAGEVCISADTAKRYAAEHDHKFAEELTLYLVHGYLHLSGYDDLKPATRKQMRAAERRAMAAVKAATKLPAFTLAR